MKNKIDGLNNYTSPEKIKTLENEQFVNNKSPYPTVLAILIWLLTSATLGIGWFFYSVLFEGNGEVWICVPATIGAAVVSLPVLLVLCFVIPFIKNLSCSTVGKIKILILTCLICTLPYALIVSNFSAGNYMHNYLLYVLAISGILFTCSIVAMLVTSRMIKQIFSDEPVYTFSFDQKNHETENDHGLIASNN